jgi:nucleoside-diphosphate-sugar epimerase
LNTLFFGFPEEDIKAVYGSCGDIWPKLDGSQILVMGGTGFIGQWLVASLGYAQLAGHTINITVLSRDPRTHLKKFSSESFQISWIEGDVSKPLNLDVEKYEFIVNAATPSSAMTGAVIPSYVYDSIISGNSKVLNGLHNHALRYIYLSSGAVTQLEKSELNFERDMCERQHLDTLGSAYSHGKRFAEIDIARTRDAFGLNAQSLRLYAFAGPGLPLDQHFAAGNFMRNYLTADSIEIKGNPKTQRSYMYPTDLVTHIAKSLISNETETRELGSTEVVSMMQLANLISSSRNPPLITVGDLSQPVSSYFPTSDKVLAQTINLDESIRRWKEWLISVKS